MFEERLLAELKADITARASADTPATAGVTRRRFRTWTAAAGLVAAVGTATGLIIVELSGGTSNPTPTPALAAYTIAKTPGGSVRVSIREFKNPGLLQADLKKAGINALVEYDPPGTGCVIEEKSSPGPDVLDRVLSDGGVVNNERQFRLFPKALKPGMTLVLEAHGVAGAPPGDNASVLVTFSVATGNVKPCHLKRFRNSPVWYETPSPVSPTPTPPSK